MTHPIESNEIKLEKPSFSKFPFTIFGVRIRALIETLLFLTILVIFNNIFGDGKRFIDSVPHPFWIIIILISAQYGMVEGFLAVILSTLFLYIGNVPSQKPEETLFDYDVHLVWLPVMWFITAFVLGQIRLRFLNERKELVEKVAKREKEAETITEAFQKLKIIKENLEVQVASQLMTVAATFKSFESLEITKPSEILLNLSSVIVPILNPKKFSVYFSGPNGFEPAMSFGWEANENYKRRFGTQDLLYQAILGGQSILSVVNPEDEKIFQGEGILAAPLIDSETHEVFGMLKIEEMELKQLSNSTMETFKTLCDLIGLSYTNARQFKKLEENIIISTETPFYSNQFYIVQKHMFEILSKHGHFPLSQIHLKFDYHFIKNKAEPYFVNSVLYILLKEILPETAMAFHGKRKWMDFIILLPLTHLEEAERIQQQVQKSILSNEYLKVYNTSYEVVSLTQAGH